MLLININFSNQLFLPKILLYRFWLFLKAYFKKQYLCVHLYSVYFKSISSIFMCFLLIVFLCAPRRSRISTFCEIVPINACIHVCLPV